MRLHVLAGCRELLQPEILAPELAGSLIGPQVKFATAPWLSSKTRNNYHYFLQEEPGDRRTKVMALSLCEDFGKRYEPLLVLPDLLDEIESEQGPSCPKSSDLRTQLTVLSEIWAHGNLGRVCLYALALPAEADPKESWATPNNLITDKVRHRIGNLRIVEIVETGADDISTEVIEITPDHAVFATLYRNAICNQIALRLASRLREKGWNSNVEALARTVSGTLSDWYDKGVSPSIPIHGDQLDTMTEIIHEKWF